MLTNTNILLELIGLCTSMCSGFLNVFATQIKVDMNGNEDNGNATFPRLQQPTLIAKGVMT